MKRILAILLPITLSACVHTAPQTQVLHDQAIADAQPSLKRCILLIWDAIPWKMP